MAACHEKSQIAERHRVRGKALFWGITLLQTDALSLSPEEEPPCDYSDLALFDQCRVANTPRLFDRDLPDFVEERFERHVYALSRKGGLRPFLSPSGEVVQRYRGGKGYTAIYESWRPEGLLRVRGRLMAALVPTEGGGRTVSWTDHPRGWSATPPELPPPFVLRQMIPVSADRVPERNTLGPTIDTDERLGSRWTPEEARQLFLLEFREGWAKALACSHRVNTSERGNRGDPNDGLSLRTGRLIGEQKAAGPRLNKPGPKPEHGFSLDARLRKIKSRCKKRGIPFVLAQYLKPKREPEHEHSCDAPCRTLVSRGD